MSSEAGRQLSNLGQRPGREKLGRLTIELSDCGFQDLIPDRRKYSLVVTAHQHNSNTISKVMDTKREGGLTQDRDSGRSLVDG